MTGGLAGPGDGARARVARVDFRSCVLLTDRDEVVEAVASGALMGRGKRLGNRLVVGDRVLFEPGAERARVLEVEPRRNQFSRRATGGRSEEQVVAANLDQVALVISIAEPEFKPGFADRVLCAATRAAIPFVLALNKSDLGRRAEIEEVLDAYRRAGAPGHALCARTGEGVEALRDRCRGRRTLFVGASGVGKSTLLNAMVPGLDLLAGRVNPTTGKGRHTTTAAWLVRAAPDLELIDTPGVRTFALWDITARELERCYAEIEPFVGHCRFGDCRHHREPGCAVLAAVEAGTISRRRFESFLKLREELETEAAR